MNDVEVQTCQLSEMGLPNAAPELPRAPINLILEQFKNQMKAFRQERMDESCQRSPWQPARRRKLLSVAGKWQRQKDGARVCSQYNRSGVKSATKLVPRSCTLNQCTFAGTATDQHTWSNDCTAKMRRLADLRSNGSFWLPCRITMRRVQRVLKLDGACPRRSNHFYLRRTRVA